MQVTRIVIIRCKKNTWTKERELIAAVPGDLPIIDFI